MARDTEKKCSEYSGNPLSSVQKQITFVAQLPSKSQAVVLLIVAGIFLITVTTTLERIVSTTAKQSDSITSGRNSRSIVSHSCPRGQHPNFQTKLCTPWSELVVNQKLYTVNANGANYTVCVPAKNGSTYHMGLIFRILGVEGYGTKRGVHADDENKARMALLNFSDTEIADVMEGDSEKYALIRNPMTRALSGFMSIRGTSLRGLDGPKEFQEWVTNDFSRRRHKLSTRNLHVRPQIEVCGYRTAGLKGLYRQFRVEEPSKYVDYLYSIVPNTFLNDGWGTYANLSFREFVLEPRVRTHGTDDKFLTYVGSLDVFDTLADVLKDDIEFFGYQDDVREMRITLASMLKDDVLL